VSEQSESDQHQEVQESVTELVRRSLIQLGDMDAMQERLRRVSERMSRITPLPERPKEK
jgi:pimeloyl-CoA synthetase